MARDRQDEIAIDTIDLLEARLERIILLLSGMEPPEGEGELRKHLLVGGEGEGEGKGGNPKEQSVGARLVRLEKGLDKVVGGNRVLGELMGVCMKFFFSIFLSFFSTRNTQIHIHFGFSWEERGFGGKKADGCFLEIRYRISRSLPQ